MTCEQWQYRMADNFQAFLRDPVAQEHVAACPRCSAVQAQEQLVRSALTAMFAPEPDEALMARLRAIPDLYPDAQAQPATAEPLDLSAESWPRRSARRLGRWLAAIRPASPAGRVAAGTRGGPGAADRPAPSRPRPSRLAPLLLAGAATAVALAAAFLVWPRGGAPLLGHATVTPTPSPVAPPAPEGTPPADAALPPGAMPTADPWTDAYPDPADPPGPFPNAVWENAAPAGIAAGSGDSVADFCVLPDDGLVLFILRRGKEGSADAQLAARDDQRVLLLPAHALRPRAAPVEPRVFADLGDLPGSAEAQLTALDCATQAGRVLVTRQNAWRSARDTDWQGDLWLLDGSGTRLNTVSLLAGLGETPATAALAPDGQAALVLGEREGGVHVLRLDGLSRASAADPPASSAVEAVATGIGLSLPSGSAGGIMAWSPAGRFFLLGGIQASGTDIDIFRWDGQRAERVLSAPAYLPDPAGSGASNPAPTADPLVAALPQRRGRLDPATLQLTDDGSLTWLQWLDDEAAGARAADAPAGGDPALSDLRAERFRWRSGRLDPRQDDGAEVEQSLTWPPAPSGRRRAAAQLLPASTGLLLRDEDGMIWQLGSDGPRAIVQAAWRSGRMAVAPGAAAPGAELLVYRTDPVAVDTVGAPAFHITDWLGGVALGGRP
ncbi:MAG: hypothetical protein ACH37Z_14230 [Anaerolineae bacterium]